jgi:hypothetical protein
MARLPIFRELPYTEAMIKTPLALAAALVAVLLAAACSRERLGPPPPGLHRRSASASIAYRLDGRASDALELGVREAFQLWTDSTRFKFTYEGKAKARVARDGINEIVLSKKWPDELPIGAAAWCQAYLDASGSIVEADILLNAQAFDFTTKREAREGALYVEEVLAREIGRSLGIDMGAEGGDRYRRAAPGDGFEPGIDPAAMAAYLSLYAVGN